MTSLNKLKLKQKAIIKDIKTSKIIKERLHSFGLINGVAIIYIGQAPLGSPCIYECMNTKIAIRNKIAEQIEIYD